jgi:hypothetical protein
MSASCLDDLRAFKEVAYISGYYEVLVYVALGKDMEAINLLRGHSPKNVTG